MRIRFTGRLRPPLIVLAVCALAVPLTALRASPAAADPALECTAAGQYLTDPYDPAVFYQCDANALPLRFECPRDLEFNPYKNVCDWPYNKPFGSQAAEQVSDDASDNAGQGPPGEVPDAQVRAATTARLTLSSVEVGDLITYQVGITSADPDTAAVIRVTFPPTLSWVGGQDCFWDGTQIADCMAYPSQDGLPAAAFSVAASLLDLGPQTVTVHFLASDPPPLNPVPDLALTCDTLTGEIIIC